MSTTRIEQVINLLHERIKEHGSKITIELAGRYYIFGSAIYNDDFQETCLIALRTVNNKEMIIYLFPSDMVLRDFINEIPKISIEKNKTYYMRL